MRVLITGAGGQVGRALSACSPRGVELFRCAREELDIGDEARVHEYVKRCAPEVVINTAAYTAVDRAESEPEAAYRANATGPRNLARSAAAFGARLVHLSTDFVFDGASSAPYRPDSPTRPLSVYGASKLAGETAVLEQMPERAVVLRTAWVYAPQGKNFVLTMLRLMRANGSARVVADQLGTPTASHSLAEVVWQVVGLRDLHGIHHWTDAGVASWYDFAVAIAEEAHALGILEREPTVIPISTAEYPTPARRPAYSVLDTRSLTSLGITPIHWRKRLRAVLREIPNA